VAVALPCSASRIMNLPMNVLGQKNCDHQVEQPSPQRILAVDYGRKKIGLALSDELGLTAQPLAVLARKNRLADLNRLREICMRYSVGRIVVGYPVHITGQKSEMAAEAARFAARIARDLKIQTELLDERLTSWEAKQIVSRSPFSVSRRGGAIDDVAAAVLLRDYLEHRRSRDASMQERG
jgi:putative holliday junction resolvase